MRFSTFPFSSVTSSSTYAAQSTARKMRSTPTAGSMTWGTNFFFEASSKISCGLPEALACWLRSELAQDDALFHISLFLRHILFDIRRAEHGEEDAVDAHRRLDDMGDKLLLRSLVEDLLRLA